MFTDISKANLKCVLLHTDSYFISVLTDHSVHLPFHRFLCPITNQGHNFSSVNQKIKSHGLFLGLSNPKFNNLKNKKKQKTKTQAI